MNILIIEDDVFLARRVGKIFETKTVSNRVKVLHSYLEFSRELPIISSYDIVLTDLRLENSDRRDPCGYKIIRAIREKKVGIPIVVISGFSDIDSMRLAFEYGASDYIMKPVRLKELELRVANWFKNHALSRHTARGNVYKYKDLSYNLDTNEFYFRQNHIPLTKNNKYILSLFFNSPEKLLRESFLVEKIWWDICDEADRNLRVNILRLKNSLSPFGIEDWIRNVRGEWYMMSAR